MDNLQKHIKSRQDQFDIYEADFGLIWENIDFELGTNSKPKLLAKQWFPKVAAISILISGLAITFFINYSTIDFETHFVSEVNKIEEHYDAKLAEKIVFTSNTLRDNPELSKELEMLGKEYELLKYDLKDKADEKEVIEAMVENYKLRLLLLERIMLEVKGDQIDYDKNIGI